MLKALKIKRDRTLISSQDLAALLTEQSIMINLYEVEEEEEVKVNYNLLPLVAFLCQVRMNDAATSYIFI